MPKTILEVQHLEKYFGDNLVLRDIDFQVEPGEVISIIGASGSGKSTLLRCLNLLEEPTDGDILYHDESILSNSLIRINTVQKLEWSFKALIYSRI